MIFAALMCCLVSVSAQQLKNEPKYQPSLQDRVAQVEKLNRYANTFSETLDSIYGDFQKCVLEYDDRFNCVKIDNYWFYDDWILDYTEGFAYDEQNRIVTITESGDDYSYKIEYLYNENSMVSKEFEFELLDDVWDTIGKTIYEYDPDGHMVTSNSYDYDGEWIPSGRMTWEYVAGKLDHDIYYYYGETDWMPLTRNDYAYNSEGLCREQLQSHWEGVWTESYKIEYEYDEAGNRQTVTSSTRYELDDWIYTYKTRYYYDENGNCHASEEYYYNETDWEIESTTTYNYDLAVSVETTAGILMIWDEDLPIHNKLLDCQIRAYGDEWNTTFYYSDCVGLVEKPECTAQLWPNPASETVHINGLDAAEVQVYNALGQIVKTVKSSNEINVSDLAEGVYLLRITSIDGKASTSRLIIQ